MRKLISKKASIENPFSEFNTVIYRQSDYVFDSVIVQNKEGKWHEEITKVYDKNELLKIRNDFAVKVFLLS